MRRGGARATLYRHVMEPAKALRHHNALMAPGHYQRLQRIKRGSLCCGRLAGVKFTLTFYLSSLLVIPFSTFSFFPRPSVHSCLSFSSSLTILRSSNLSFLLTILIKGNREEGVEERGLGRRKQNNSKQSAEGQDQDDE